jgi:hypothetical protein
MRVCGNLAIDTRARGVGIIKYKMASWCGNQSRFHPYSMHSVETNGFFGKRLRISRKPFPVAPWEKVETKMMILETTLETGVGWPWKRKGVFWRSRFQF